MKEKKYKGRERRQFVRLDYVTPLDYKVCKKKTISKLLQGYTANVSESGLLCNIKDKVKKGDILWLSFDRGTLSFCEGLDKKSLIYQNGIIGKVARIEQKKNSFDIGIYFIDREEKNSTHIYPKMHFLKYQKQDVDYAAEEKELEIEAPLERERQEEREEEQIEENEEN